MNEVWRLTIEIMDYKSIEALSRTNSSFRKYVNVDSEYIYRKLLEREFDCIKGYKDLYLLLKASRATETSAYKNKCIKEGLHFDCKTLINKVNKFIDINSYNDRNYVVPIHKLINMVNSIINCLEKYKFNSKNYELISNVNKLLIENNKSAKALESEKWRNWYPIAMNRLQEIHTPKLF